MNINTASSLQRTYCRQSYETSKSKLALMQMQTGSCYFGTTIAQRIEIDRYFEQKATELISLFENEENKRIVCLSNQPNGMVQQMIIELSMQMLLSEQLNLDASNVFVVSNTKQYVWESQSFEIIAPSCLTENIINLQKYSQRFPGDHMPFAAMKNGILLCEDIDCFEKDFEYFVSQSIDSHVLTIDKLKENNNYVVFVNGEMWKQFFKMYSSQWRQLHIQSVVLDNIPYYSSYETLLQSGYVEEMSRMTMVGGNISDWIQTDILDQFNDEYKIHIVRSKDRHAKINIKTICLQCNIQFLDATENTEKSQMKLHSLFIGEPLSRHVIVVVRTMFRNLSSFAFPHEWKRRLGSLHEMLSKQPDPSTHLFGLTSLGCGFFQQSHPRGPYRSSIEVLEYFVQVQKEPFDKEGNPRFFSDYHFEEKKMKLSKAKIHKKEKVPCVMPENEHYYDFKLSQEPIKKPDEDLELPDLELPVEEVQEVQECDHTLDELDLETLSGSENGNICDEEEQWIRNDDEEIFLPESLGNNDVDDFSPVHSDDESEDCNRCSDKEQENEEHSQTKSSEDPALQSRYRIYKTTDQLEKVCKKLKYLFHGIKRNEQGFVETILNRQKGVLSLDYCLHTIKQSLTKGKQIQTHNYFSCYEDVYERDTECFVLLLKEDLDPSVIHSLDQEVAPTDLSPCAVSTSL